MQTTLSAEELASITRELTVWAQLRGPEILGSQLGKLINDALSPRHAREFGGVRTLVQNVFSQNIRLRETDIGADLVYEILATAQPATQPLRVPVTPRAVAGIELWRFFSNPNLRCQLAVNPPATVLVASAEHSFPEEYVPLSKISTDEYRKLAEQFLQEHGTNPEVAPVLQQALQEVEFYKPWIAALRRFRVDSVDFLKSWEILRTASVEKHLANELEKAGVEATRVAEIVQLARPVAKSVRMPSHVINQTAPSGSPVNPSAVHISLQTPHRFAGGGSATTHDNTAELRQLIHRAVDLMSSVELREVRISADTLLKLTSKHGM